MTNKGLAVLIRDVIGARPKYGDESAKPSYWPDDVSWQKGKSISQVTGGRGRGGARGSLRWEQEEFVVGEGWFVREEGMLSRRDKFVGAKGVCRKQGG